MAMWYVSRWFAFSPMSMGAFGNRTNRGASYFLSLIVIDFRAMNWTPYASGALAGFHYQEALMVLNQTVISDFQLELEGVKRLINALSIIFPFKIALESKRLRQGACFKHQFAP